MNRDNKHFFASGFLRLPQIIGGPEHPPLIPVSKSTWWAGVKAGKFPQPIKLGERTTVWRTEDILAFIEKAGARHG